MGQGVYQEAKSAVPCIGDKADLICDNTSEVGLSASMANRDLGGIFN